MQPFLQHSYSLSLSLSLSLSTAIHPIEVASRLCWSTCFLAPFIRHNAISLCGISLTHTYTHTHTHNTQDTDLSLVQPNFGSVQFKMSSLDQFGVCSPQRSNWSSQAEKLLSLSMEKTRSNPPVTNYTTASNPMNMTPHLRQACWPAVEDITTQ